MASKSSAEKTIELLISAETIADKILVNKQEIIALDKRRQETRESIREIKKHNEPKVWITIGSMLVKLTREKALELLEKDKVHIDNEINKLRSEQKLLVNEHRDVEFKMPFTGSTLKPMSSKEMSALKANFPMS